MKQISDYLDAFRTAKNLPSDYAAANLLGLTKQAVSKYRHNKGAFDIDVAWRISDATGIDLAEIIAAGEIARANAAHDAERAQLWARRFRDLSAVLSVVFIGFFGMMAAAPAGAVTAVRCILCQIAVERPAAHRHRRSVSLTRSKIRHFLDFFAISGGPQYAKLF